MFEMLEKRLRAMDGFFICDLIRTIPNEDLEKENFVKKELLGDMGRKDWCGLSRCGTQV